MKKTAQIQSALAFSLTVLIVLLAVGPVHATVHSIDVGSFFFTPLKTVVSPGDTVRWTKMPSIFSHTTTSAIGSPKIWNSGIIPDNASFDVVFTAGDGPGPFPYVCAVHPFTMIDTIFMNAPPVPEPTLFPFILDDELAAACAGTGNEVGKGVFQRYKLARRDGLHWSFARCVQIPDEAGLARWERMRAQQIERMQARAEKAAAEAAGKA